MSPVFFLWVIYASIVGRVSYVELTEETKTVRLFKQTETGYITYTVEVPK